jgi:hypothetical protein
VIEIYRLTRSAIARADEQGSDLRPGPGAFQDERTHVFQIRTHGRPTTAMLDTYEGAACGIENTCIDYWRSGG